MAAHGEDGGYELYECQVCLQDMVDRRPRYLRCHHSFCTECLNRLVGGGKIICPICRQETGVTNGVESLTVNFLLVKMKEREKWLKTDKTKDLLCKFCEVSTSINKCLECNKTLCEECTCKHTKMKFFRSHTIKSVCKRHAEAITHVCLHCVEGACVTCLMSIHIDHEDRVKDFAEGLIILRKEADDNKQKLVSKSEELDQHLQNVCKQNVERDQLKCRIRERIVHYEEKIAVYQQKVDYAKGVLQILENKYDKEGKALHESMLVAKQSFERQHALLEKVQEQTDLTFLYMFMEAEKNKTEETVLGPFSCPDSPFQLADESASTESIPDIVIATSSCFPCGIGDSICAAIRQFPLEPTLLWSAEKVDAVNAPFLSPIDIAVGRGSYIYVADYSARTVYQFPCQGSNQALGYYTPPNCEEVRSVSISNSDPSEDFYVAAKHKISHVSAKHMINLSGGPFDLSHVRSFVKTPRIRRICLMESDNVAKLIITEDANHGRVFEYIPKYNVLKVLVRKLRSPSYITVIPGKKDIKYLISIENEHCIHAYDSDWNLMRIIGGEGSADGNLNTPHATAVTHTGTLLVADCGNDRICEYGLDGVFKGHLLTRDHGIRRPRGLAFKYPFIWITEMDMKCPAVLKCFRIF